MTLHYVEAEEAGFLHQWWHQRAYGHKGAVPAWPTVNGHSRRPQTQDETGPLLPLLDKLDWRAPGKRRPQG